MLDTRNMKHHETNKFKQFQRTTRKDLSKSWSSHLPAGLRLVALAARLRGASGAKHRTGGAEDELGTAPPTGTWAENLMSDVVRVI